VEKLQGSLATGYYIQPTLLKGHNKMRVFQEEIFGPVVSVTTFKDEAEALAIANDTEFGLGAGVWTRDINRAYRMGRGIKAGRVWTNCYHLYPAHAAFGGYKKSGVGRETHKMMLDHYQQTKNLLISYDINPLGFSKYCHSLIRLTPPCRCTAAVMKRTQFMSIQQEQTISLAHGVETEGVDAHYFQNRQLKQGAAGWVLLIGLGVAYVISGDFAGWNFGLAQGGWGGMFLATLLMAAMYLCMCFSMAELSSMIPTAGGGYGFVRTAFGPWGGFFAGAAILLEYAIAPAAIAVFIGAYCESLFGVGGWPIYLAFYTVFIGIHVLGAERP